MESYLQAVGRDGSDVLSAMFYHAYHLCHCDPTMRAFFVDVGKYYSFLMRRSKNLPYCTSAVMCRACPEEMFKICSDLDNCPCTLERKVNTNERDTFTEVLKDLAVTCQANISVLEVFVFKMY